MLPINLYYRNPKTNFFILLFLFGEIPCRRNAQLLRVLHHLSLSLFLPSDNRYQNFLAGRPPGRGESEKDDKRPIIVITMREERVEAHDSEVAKKRHRTRWCNGIAHNDVKAPRKRLPTGLRNYMCTLFV